MKIDVESVYWPEVNILVEKKNRLFLNGFLLIETGIFNLLLKIGKK